MQISRQVKRIETIQTEGELGALIKESDLIKKLMPIYNRRLRKSERVSILKTFLDEDGYVNVRIENTDEHQIKPDDLPNIVGLFRTKRQAENQLKKILEEHRLCKKMLGLEKTKRACFGYQLKKCHGACAKEEPTGLYNLRVELAFNKLRFKKWPYEQPLMVMEGKDQLLLDKWCYLGKVDNDDAGIIVQDVKFDLDIYKILKAFLQDPLNHKKIKVYERQLQIA